jgi:hypothetical protein
MLTDQVLSSTLLLTILLLVGLISFVKSSVKDRTTEMIFTNNSLDDDRLLAEVRTYFKQRAYEVTQIDPTKESVTLTGQVKPSVFLAILIVVLVAIGLTCLGLVLSILVPALSDNWWLMVLASPLAGMFYWRGADRMESVSLELRPSSRLWVRGHKDELTELQRSLSLGRES